MKDKEERGERGIITIMDNNELLQRNKQKKEKDEKEQKVEMTKKSLNKRLPSSPNGEEEWMQNHA